MVVDVIDIRKRIEKIRNDVSEAIVSQHDFEAREEALREDISLSISPNNDQIPATDLPELPLSDTAAGMNDTNRFTSFSQATGALTPQCLHGKST